MSPVFASVLSMKVYFQFGLSLSMLLNTALEVNAQSDGTPVLPKEIEEYTLEFERIQSLDRLERNIEVLYRKGIVAGKSLLSPVEISDLYLLERLSQEQLRAVSRALPGIFLTREEVLQARPDAKSYLEFALKWGGRADIAYFSTLQIAYPSPGWPLYIEPQTDYGGCRRLGSFVFSELYGMWRAFQSRFPDRYKQEVGEELADLEENLLHPGACEGPREVAEAYREFIRSFPDEPVSNEIRLRISEIENGTSNLRFNLSLP